ncbi:MAG: uL15m family ribosomal protein, partial [Cyanobacteria bacterium P01_F01_bin.153]
DLSDVASGTTVNLAYLVDEGVVTVGKSPLKVLGDGELNVALTVEAAAFSKSAKAKIEAAGGTCTVVPMGPEKWVRSK